MRVGWSSWSIEVPDEWSVIDHPECLTVELPDHGSLQMSSSRKQSGVVATEDLFFRDDLRATWGAYRLVTCGEFSGVGYEYLHEGDLWRCWYLRCGQILLFATFIANPLETSMQQNLVDSLLASLRLETAGEA